MNPGDKVRVTKKGPVFGREGVFDSWQRVPGGGTPFCLVRFKNEKTGNYVMYFDAWDLEPVEEVIEPTASKTCDIEFTTGRRLKQVHNCTLPVGHTQNFHYCSICGQEYSIQRLEIIVDSAVPRGNIILVPKYAAFYPDPVIEGDTNEGS